MQAKEKKKLQSLDHREVINICMTGQMTAYFHGNIVVSSEMSGGDGWCGCVCFQCVGWTRDPKTHQTT